MKAQATIRTDHVLPVNRDEDPHPARRLRCGTAQSQLIELIHASRETPCFICAPEKTGRSSLALGYARQFHRLEEVLWIDGSSESFCQALDTNRMLEYLEQRITEGLFVSKLVVIDDLPLLGERQAALFSDWIDRLIERCVELIVITKPQDDCLADFQSDRLLVDGKSLISSQVWQKNRRAEALECFFKAPIPKELISLAALMLLMGRGIVDNLRELGYRIAAGSHILLKKFCPFYEIDDETGYFDTSCFSAEDFMHILPALVNEAPHDGEDEGLSDLERTFERLTQLSLHLLERSEREQSQLILELIGTLIAYEEDEDRVDGGITSSAREGAGNHRPKEIGEDRSLRESRQSSRSTGFLVIRLFGDFEILRSGHRLEGQELRRRKVRELLIHLVLNGGRGIARDTLMERLWPDKDYAHAKDNFYSTWSRLSRTLVSGESEAGYISNQGGLCRLEAGTVSTDVHEFEQLAKYIIFEQGSVEQRVEAIFRSEQLYRGDILSGCKLDPHVLAAQQRYRSLLVDIMLAASKLFSQEGNDANAVWFARKAFDADSSREDVYRILMTMQDRAGQRTSALKTYFDCKRFLGEELGILPSQKTTALYQELILDRR